VKHVDDFTDKQTEDVWFTEHDLNVIWADWVAAVCHMMHKDVVDEETDCTRGLEFKTPAGAKFCKNSKQTAMQGVMAEQGFQKSTCVADEEHLSESYQEASGNSKHPAHLMALCDEQHDKPTKETESTEDTGTTKEPRRAKSA
jgi:hypothetical protein